MKTKIFNRRFVLRTKSPDFGKGMVINMEIDKDRFDFFSEKETDFYKKFTEESVLVQGKHRCVIPFVTIIIPTYKRPQLLKQALNSALNQKKFDDYQIVIADNEGAPIEEETETSRLIAGYHDEKIIYYRHMQSVNYKMDYAVRLARSPWICFLHDDDLLSENHLSVLTRIIKKYKEIKFLSCPFENFYNTISDNQFTKMVKRRKGSYHITKYPPHYSCTGYYPGWLGALINRECYINTGGMPTLKTGAGDYCMVGKFAYRYGVYECSSQTALYLRRKWTGQLTAGGTEVWTQLYANEYKFHKYVNEKYHPVLKEYWNRISAYRILEKCRLLNNGDYNTRIDLQEVIEMAGMPDHILEKGKQYERDILWLTIYEYLVTGKGNAGWKETSDKHLALFLLMNQWVRMQQKGKTVGKYLEQKGYERVAVYGMSYVGLTLLKDLQNSNIQVAYAIDKGTSPGVSECKVITPDSALQEVDAIIVTPVYYFDEIKRNLSKKITCPVISLKDIVTECL